MAAGLTPARALKSPMSVAAEPPSHDDSGVFAPGKHADIVAMPEDPFADTTARVDFVMRSRTVVRGPDA